MTLALDRFIGLARNRGQAVAAMYQYYEEFGWAKADPYNNRVFNSLHPDDQKALMKARDRKIKKSMEEAELIQRERETKARTNFLKTILGRKRFKALRKCFSIKSLWDSFKHNRCNTASELHSLAELTKTDAVYWRERIGRFMKNRELNEIDHRWITQPETPLHLKLPLYACSGELEANTMHKYRIAKLSRGKHGGTGRVTCHWRHSDGLNFATDGGGQAETQFHIEPIKAKIVCGLVETLGPVSRNGGHIHINCQKDELIGERVYDAMRYHMTWIRWMVNYTRRHHHWSNMDTIASCFDQAKRVKATALSCNTWERTGTVEVRLWGTTNKPEQWIGRAKTMQAIAKWSETHVPEQAEINQSTEGRAWPLFFQWAAVNEPEALVFILNTFRKKIRSTTTANADRVACQRLMYAFEESGITVRGYRRRNRVGVNSSAVTTA